MGQWMASSELEHPMVCCGVVLSPSPSTTPVTKGGTQHPYQHQVRALPACKCPQPCRGERITPGTTMGTRGTSPVGTGQQGPAGRLPVGLLDRGRPQQDAATHSLGLVWLCGKLYFHTNVFGFFFSSHYKLNSSNSLQGEICFSLLCKGTAASFS